MPPRLLALAFSTALAAPAPAAGPKLASVFGDHMVVQRDRPVAVWGTADPGSRVEVALASHRTSAEAGADGRWAVTLPPLPAGGPHTLSVSGGGARVTRSDVLAGDVWLCSGQSNMQMTLKECDGGPEAAATQAARLPGLRFCAVAKRGNARPQDAADVRWSTLTPTTARDVSAVGYWFAARLLADPALAGVPVGVIDSSFGGTMCEGWLPDEALARFDRKDLHDSMFGLKPGTLFNGMIAPLGRTGLRGVVWYQGEGNAGRPETYARLVTTLFAEWRKRFETPDLPFVVVGLPDWAHPAGRFYWQWLREAQARAVAATPHTALAVGVNTTDGFDLHPKQKREVGRRAALLALHDVYSRPVVARGPVFKTAVSEGPAVRLTFDTGGDGLAAAEPGPVRGFAVAGADGAYRFADATIEGDAVVLRSPLVPAPKTVRYAWAGVPRATLANRSGLPAAPFRTDDLSPGGVEVQPRPAARHLAAGGYEVTVDADGRVTSLGVRGRQFLSNALGTAGGTSIPGFFGNRALPDVRDLGPDLLSCGDNDLALLLEFRDMEMVWSLTNQGSTDVRFRVALATGVAVAGKGGAEPVRLSRGKAAATVAGVGAVEDGEDGKVLEVTVKGGGTARLRWAFGD